MAVDAIKALMMLVAACTNFPQLRVQVHRRIANVSRHYLRLYDPQHSWHEGSFGVVRRSSTLCACSLAVRIPTLSSRVRRSHDLQDSGRCTKAAPPPAAEHDSSRELRYITWRLTGCWLASGYGVVIQRSRSRPPLRLVAQSRYFPLRRGPFCRGERHQIPGPVVLGNTLTWNHRLGTNPRCRRQAGFAHIYVLDIACANWCWVLGHHSKKISYFMRR